MNTEYSDILRALMCFLCLFCWGTHECWCNNDSDHGSTYWIKQLVDNRFHLNDSTIEYPKFPKWCVKVYNWGDRTFNTYDTAYVVGTGKNWKVSTKSHNWIESYAMHLSDHTSLMMHSTPHTDLGLYLNFMAVGIGYTVDAKRIFGGSDNENARKHFYFNFCCALFSINYDYSKTNGGIRITKFGDNAGNYELPYKFDNIGLESKELSFYYFFNHRKYSQAAAYSYSKYQLKSAGTWILGAKITNQDILMDFSTLPDEMLESMPTLKRNYRFHYTDYDIIGGYAHNWVLKPRKLLINLTALPSIGYKYSFRNANEGRKNMISTNFRAMLSIVYNLNNFFFTGAGHFDGHINYSDDYVFVNSLESFSFCVGLRF